MIDKHETTEKSVKYDFPQEIRSWTLLRPYYCGNDNFWWIVRALICWYSTNRSNDCEWQCERCDLNTPLILLPFPKLDLHVHNCFWEVSLMFQRSLLILKCQWKRRKSPLYFSTYHSCSCCRQPSLSQKRFTTEMQFLLTVTSRQTPLHQETLMQESAWGVLCGISLQDLSKLWEPHNALSGLMLWSMQTTRQIYLSYCPLKGFLIL